MNDDMMVTATDWEYLYADIPYFEYHFRVNWRLWWPPWTPEVEWPWVEVRSGRSLFPIMLSSPADLLFVDSQGNSVGALHDAAGNYVGSITSIPSVTAITSVFWLISRFWVRIKWGIWFCNPAGMSLSHFNTSTYH